MTMPNRKTAILRVIILLPFIHASTGFLEKNESACHSFYDCGRAHLTCDVDQRLAILRVRHAHHLNITDFDQCLSNVQNCSEVPNECCKTPTPPLDCYEDYVNSEILVDAYRNCSAQITRSHGNVTCDLMLPPIPEPSRGRCSTTPIFRTMSSYSTVDYACVYESDVAQLCVASKRQGNLLYTLWTPEQSFVNTSDVNITSCQCSVTSTSTSPVTVFIRVLDIRISKSGIANECSYVTVEDGVTTRLNTTCAADTTIMFDSTSQQKSMMEAVTPIDVILSMNINNVPDIVWIGFSAQLNQENLTVTCYDAGVNTTTATHQTQEERNGNDTSLPTVAAVVIGVVAVVIVVIAGFVCFYFVNKKRNSASGTKRPKAKSWWERTREEDHLAGMSQLGPASRVNVDTGRHMAYGRHPVTRRSFPTTEDNPLIFVVSGTAASPPSRHGGLETVPVGLATSFDGRVVMVNEPSDGRLESSTEAAAASARPESSGERFEPRVVYRVSANQDSIVLTTGEAPVKSYDIPPLTIKELE